MLPAVVRILRPGNAAMTGIAVVAGAFVAAGAGLPWVRVLLAAGVGFAFAGAGNGANDVRDVTIDRWAHPDRPLPRGELSMTEARSLVVGLYAAAVAGGLVLGVGAAALVVSSLVLMEAYERDLKARGLPGNVVVAVLTGAPFVLGGLAAGSVPRALVVLAGLAALTTLGREVLKDMEDMGQDAGRRTLPQRVGGAAAARVAAGALVAAVLLSPAPFLLGESVLGWTYISGVCLADAAFLAAAWGRGNPGRAQRVAKSGMVLALVAFILGRAQVVW